MQLLELQPAAYCSILLQDNDLMMARVKDLSNPGCLTPHVLCNVPLYPAPKLASSAQAKAAAVCLAARVASASLVSLATLMCLASLVRYKK